MSLDAYRHADTRPYIPSTEEAGSEADNDRVKARATADYPLNPVTTRGQDPELYWLNKYGPDDQQERLSVDIRSLYRAEHVGPELLMQRLYKLKEEKPSQLDLFNLFGNHLDHDELDKVTDYYQHDDTWKNRLIQGDSLLVMSSLLEREGMAGKVQTIYIDPPYGIKYGSNWQLRLNNRDVKDGADDQLSGEPEQIKAFRDTWELGIHSYLSYLRDRLLVARDLLTSSGSCFVQISDENVHLVRCLMDEVFGSENFVSLVTYTKTTGFSNIALSNVADFIIWYAKDIDKLKYRQLYKEKQAGEEGATIYRPIESFNNITPEMKAHYSEKRLVTLDQLTSQGASPNSEQTVEFENKLYSPPKGLHWKTTVQGIRRLAEKLRIVPVGNSLRYLRLFDDYPVFPITNLWTDTGTGSFTDEKLYIVQTGIKAVTRCLLMTTDPGDLVLDPTCGSGTTAYVAEQWGRRWITIDTSRIALNVAKTRLMTATFPYYHLYADVQIVKTEKDGKIKKTITPLPEPQTLEEKAARGNVRLGFVYEEVPHIT